MLSLTSMPLAFAPVAAPVYSRSAVRSNAPQMLEETSRCAPATSGTAAMKGPDIER